VVHKRTFKFKIILPFLLISFLVGCDHSSKSLSQLRNSIKKRFDTTKQGAFALAFKNLADTTDTIYINDREMFHAASTMKVPVLIEAFKQINEGKFKLGDSIKVYNHFKSIVDSSTYQLDSTDDSYPKLYHYIGQKRPIHDLLFQMITNSSNLAADIMINKVGVQNINPTMRSLGADSILVLRGVEDIKAYKAGISDSTDARDLMILFEKLAKGKVVSLQASKQMIAILEQQKFNDKIPAELPDSVQVAHKTGAIPGVHHDAGLIILPDGQKYVLVLLSKDAPDGNKVTQMFADISKDIYDYVVSSSSSN
jgi:beta-lactamase class A